MEYYRIVVDAWRMFREFRSKTENSEKFFTVVLDACTEIRNRHPYHHDFTDGILMVFLEELRRIAEGGKK